MESIKVQFIRSSRFVVLWFIAPCLGWASATVAAEPRAESALPFTAAGPMLSPVEVLPSPSSPTAPKPTLAVSENVALPSQRKFVSILKRKLPEQPQTFDFQETPEWFQNLLVKIARENIPETYVRDKDWGKTDKRWDGLDVEREGLLKWHTKRKWKQVNDGTWKRYAITQIDPQENLHVRLENVRDAGDGKVGFELLMRAKLHVDARTAKWTKGVQLYSINADALAVVELKVSCEVGMKLGLSFPPDVIFTPDVRSADVDLVDFRLQKVSKLDGPLVRKLSGSVRRLLEDKIEEKRDGLPAKINKQLAKNQDKMKLSLSEFVKADDVPIERTSS